MHRAVKRRGSRVCEQQEAVGPIQGPQVSTAFVRYKGLQLLGDRRVRTTRQGVPHLGYQDRAATALPAAPAPQRPAPPPGAQPSALPPIDLAVRHGLPAHCQLAVHPQRVWLPLRAGVGVGALPAIWLWPGQPHLQLAAGQRMDAGHVLACQGGEGGREVAYRGCGCGASTAGSWRRACWQEQGAAGPALVPAALRPAGRYGRSALLAAHQLTPAQVAALEAARAAVQRVRFHHLQRAGQGGVPSFCSLNALHSASAAGSMAPGAARPRHAAPQRLAAKPSAAQGRESAAAPAPPYPPRLPCSL